MKKLRLTKKELVQLKLGTIELSQLKGGIMSLDGRNTNGWHDCKCTYNNGGNSVTNDNEVDGCKCVCT